MTGLKHSFVALSAGTFAPLTFCHRCRDVAGDPARVLILPFSSKLSLRESGRGARPAVTGLTSFHSVCLRSLRSLRLEQVLILPFSSRLSLRESGRGDRIRTCGLVVPNDARYQAALHPDGLCRAVPFRRAGRNRSRDAPTDSGGAPVGIRTPNLLIRSQVLYPVELRVLYQRASAGYG